MAFPCVAVTSPPYISMGCDNSLSAYYDFPAPEPSVKGACQIFNTLLAPGSTPSPACLKCDAQFLLVHGPFPVWWPWQQGAAMTALVSISTSLFIFADSGWGRKWDALPHHSWVCCHKAVPSWPCYPACLDRIWLLLGSWQCWLRRQNGQVAAMHGRAQKALAFQIGSLQISLCDCSTCFGTSRELIPLIRIC